MCSIYNPILSGSNNSNSILLAKRKKNMKRKEKGRGKKDSYECQGSETDKDERSDVEKQTETLSSRYLQ